jgi:hypothetical protein
MFMMGADKAGFFNPDFEPNTGEVLRRRAIGAKEKLSKEIRVARPWR